MFIYRWVEYDFFMGVLLFNQYLITTQYMGGVCLGPEDKRVQNSVWSQQGG